MKRIVLFTAFSPKSGGGGTNLRSIVPALAEDYTIFWLYTSVAKCDGFEDGWLGAPLVGGSNSFSDMLSTAGLLAGKSTRAVEVLIQKLLSVECDAYWIVSHNEGLRVALELCQRSDRPVHLTIQDDWAGALCARSTRYRVLAPLARRMSDRTIKAVRSLDGTSEGMREYYRQRTGVDSVVIHPVIPEHLPEPVDQFASDKLTVGHAGSLYAVGEFMNFAKALAAYSFDTRRTVEIQMRGAALALEQLPKEFRKIVTILPACEEQKLVDELAHCHLLYAMYPFSCNLRIFTQTSLPTKLSTYVQAQRPILGHGPAQSSLATFLHDTKTGVMWSNTNVQSGVRSINSLMQQSVKRQQWENARELYYGEANIRRMLQVFQKLAARVC